MDDEKNSAPSARRLLILDDDAAIGHLIASIARGQGFEARPVSVAAEFLEQVERWAPTHIAVDLVMPEMDGVEVMRLLSGRGCRARIIISSGVGSRVLDAARRSAAEHGLDIAGVLPKPFSARALRELLGAVPASAPRPAARQAPASLQVTVEELSRAVERGEFLLAYQPKIACATGELAGFEALVRWNHPQHGVVMPDRFIPLAETSGLIDALTEQVFDRALRWFAAFAPQPGLCLSVNLSARSLADFALGERISGMCKDMSIGPERVILELTETATMQDPTTSLDLLTRMRMRGFQLSIDDFGTGYSSMLQLVRLPFSEMKIDKSFVMTSGQSRESRSVIRSIVDLGHSLGLRVAGEGVEDQQALDFLRTAGCDYAQGYFISRPMAVDAVDAWVASRRQPATHEF